MFQFPFGNFQQLNLDWFLAKFKELVEEWNDKEESIDGALDAEIQKAEDALEDVFTARDVTVAAKNDALQAKADALTAAANAAQYWQNAANSAQSAASSAVNALQAAQDASTDAAQVALDKAAVAADKAAVAADKAAVAADKAAVAADKAIVAADKAAVEQDKDDTDLLKDAANAAALRAEGWANGTQNGTPVTSESPYYENSAKFYKEAAEDVLDSIPPDYSDLAADVASQSEKITEINNKFADIGIVNIPYAKTGTGYIQDSGYIIYQTPGSGYNYMMLIEDADVIANIKHIKAYLGNNNHVYAIAFVSTDGVTFPVSYYGKFSRVDETAQTVEVDVPAGTGKIYLSNRYSVLADPVITITTNDGYEARLSVAETNGNVLSGKKWVSCGDSFTQGDFTGLSVTEYQFQDEPYKGNNKVYPYFIGRRAGATIINEAVSGSTMAYVDGERSEFSTPNGRYTQIPSDADYITLYFGINDSHQNVPIGTIDDANNTTFYGAWNVVMQYLIANHPDAKIGIIISNGCDSIDYPNAEIAIAKKYGVSYLDFNSDYKVPILFRVNGKPDTSASVINANYQHYRVSADNSHPNVALHEYESTIIQNWLESI